MASMIRKIQRGMIRRAATRGVYGSRNKAALFAVTWANYRAGKEHAKPEAAGRDDRTRSDAAGAEAEGGDAGGGLTMRRTTRDDSRQLYALAVVMLSLAGGALCVLAALVTR